MAEYFPSRFSGLFLTGSSKGTTDGRKKVDVCRRLRVEMIIEDSLPNALECAAAGIDVLLLDCPWNQNGELPEQVRRVYDWKEIVEQVQEAAARLQMNNFISKV